MAKKVFVTTPKAGTKERLYVHGTDSPQRIINGRTVAATPPKEIRFNRGLFVANDEVKYKIFDDFEGDKVLNQIEWIDQSPANVANGGMVFREHEPWMDKVDAGRLLQSNAARMSDKQFLDALHQIESMPEGHGPSPEDIQVHVGVRDASARGKTLKDVEPDYGDLEKILSQQKPADAGTAAKLKKRMREAE